MSWDKPKLIFELVAHSLPALESWKWSCIPKVMELRILRHPTAQRKKTMRRTHLLELGRIRWEWRMAFVSHQFYYLSALDSRIILCAYQKPSLPCLCIIRRFKPLGRFSGLKEPTLPNYHGRTAAQLSWEGMDGKAKVPFGCPSCWSCLCDLQTFPSTLSLFISSHHSPSLGRKRVAYNFWCYYIVVLSCQQRW